MIDLLDRKILFLLCHNARYTDTDIARSLKTSRQVVSNRISKMLHERIIHGFQTEVNYDALQYSEAILLIQSHNPEPLIHYLSKTPEHIYVSENYSKWNILSYCIFRTLKDVQNIKREIIEKYDVTTIEVLIAEKNYEYSPLFKKFFEGILHIPLPKSRSSFEKDFVLSSKKHISFQKNDGMLLHQLVQQCRTPLQEIAKKVNMSVPTIKKRMRELIRGKIIEKFVPAIDQTKIGYQTHYIFIKLQKQREKDIETAVRVLYSIDGVAYVTKTMGKYNLIVDFYTNTKEEVERITQQALLPLQDQIQELELVWALRDIKFKRYIPYKRNHNT